MYKVYVFAHRIILPVFLHFDRFRARGRQFRKAHKKRNALRIGTPLPVILGGTFLRKAMNKDETMLLLPSRDFLGRALFPAVPGLHGSADPDAA